MAQRTATTGRKPQQRGGHRIDITVWQFVRIMVQLEAVAKSRGGRRAGRPVATPQERPVYVDWRPAWQEIDRELTRLGSTDADAFSDLMMNQNVVLECRSRSQINEVMRAIDNIVHQMRAEVAASAGDEEHIADLRFEIRELEKLTRKLSGVGRKKVKKPAEKAAATPAPAKPQGKTPARTPGKASGRSPVKGAAKPVEKRTSGKRTSGKQTSGKQTSEKRTATGAPAAGRPAARRRPRPKR